MKITKITLILVAIILHSHVAQGQTKKISRYWASFTQSIALKTDKEVQFKIQAWVKVIGHKQDSTIKAGLWARVDTNNEERGFFDNMNDRPIINDTWQQYEINGTFGPNAKSLYFGGLVYFDGTFYFDDIKVFIADEKGTYVPIQINNQGFENNNPTEGWSQGIIKDKPAAIKEFTFSTSKESKEGKQSLRIEGKNTPKPPSYKIIAEKGFTPQIGVLVSMLNSLKDRVASQVRNLDQRETDHLMDEKANRIGALIMHLAAAEKIYQNLTFENRRFNDVEKEKWQTALDLGATARKKFKDKPIDYYLAVFDTVRQKTIEELQKRDDAWLQETLHGSPMNNYYGWFHVMEHQSSHLGQILMMKKRIPEEKTTPTLEEKVD